MKILPLIALACLVTTCVFAASPQVAPVPQCQYQPNGNAGGTASSCGTQLGYTDTNTGLWVNVDSAHGLPTMAGGGGSSSVTVTGPVYQATPATAPTTSIPGSVYRATPASVTDGQGVSDQSGPHGEKKVCPVDSTGACADPTLPVPVSQGAGAAVSLGWPFINGEPADTTGTFTNGTQSTAITTPSVDGYETATITLSGTYGTATGTFQASDDGGTTYYTLRCARTDSVAVESGYTTLTNTNRAWFCPIHSFDTIRVQSSAVASGTVNVRISISASPTSSGVTASISGDSTIGVEGVDGLTQASLSNLFPSSTTPSQRTLVALDVSTVTTGGTAVNALTAGHRTAGGFIQNPSNASINLCINEIGAASGTTSSASTTCILPGQSYNLTPAAGAVSVISSDSAHPFSGYGLN